MFKHAPVQRAPHPTRQDGAHAGTAAAGDARTAQLAADLNARPQAQALNALSSQLSAPPAQVPAQRKAVIQRWASPSLEHEQDQERVMGLRGHALFYAHEDEADVDEYESNEDLANFLPAREKADLQHLSALDQLSRRNMTETIHHILSRDKINSFYNLLSPDQQVFIGDLFRRQQGVGGFQGHGDGPNDRRAALLSLRSNLSLGPDGAKRADDPARNDFGTDFDPNFTATGELDANSQIYAQVDHLMGQAVGQRQPVDDGVFNQVVNLLLDAEQGLAAAQRNESFWDNRIATAGVEGNWEVRNRGQPGQKFWKRDSNRNFPR
ncbi:MAG: hypothetical protein PW843_27730 [Azospirillaceae bacterium]|nr:hypothetical protein [Azospirillaceae bacterium]